MLCSWSLARWRPLHCVQLLALCVVIGDAIVSASHANSSGRATGLPAQPASSSRSLCIDNTTKFQWMCPSKNDIRTATTCCHSRECCEPSKKDSALSTSALVLIIIGGVIAIAMLVGTVYMCYCTDHCAQRYGRDPEPPLIDKKEFCAPNKKEVIRRSSLFSAKLGWTGKPETYVVTSL